jgi:hypothetical protein
MFPSPFFYKCIFQRQLLLRSCTAFQGLRLLALSRIRNLIHLIGLVGHFPSLAS